MPIEAAKYLRFIALSLIIARKDNYNEQTKRRLEIEAARLADEIARGE